MTTIFIILVAGSGLFSQTVKGTYPPVPKKYWVPVSRGRPAQDIPTGRRKFIKSSGRNSRRQSGMDYSPLTESGIVKVVGSSRLHKVKTGETLWKISKKYFGDPWFWPKLWSWNPHVTNPHWLFPGTAIWLGPYSKKSKPVSGSSFFGLHYSTDSITFRRKAFIEEKDLKKSSYITGSAEEKSLLSPGDIIYIKQLKGKYKFVKNHKYMIYRNLKKVIHDPDVKVKTKDGKKKQKVVGRLVKILGEVIVIEVRPKNVVRARIVSSMYTIKRKDLVGVLKTKFNNIKPKVELTKKYHIGKILYKLSKKEMLSPGDIVVTNIGTKKGVSKGSVIKVALRGDGLFVNLNSKDPSHKTNKKFPFETKAELVVFLTGEKYSLALVYKSKKPVKTSDILIYGRYPDKPETAKSE